MNENCLSEEIFAEYSHEESHYKRYPSEEKSVRYVRKTKTVKYAVLTHSPINC